MEKTSEEIAILNKCNEVFFNEIANLCSFQQEFCKRESNVAKALEMSVSLISRCTGRIILVGIGKSSLAARNISMSLSAQGFPSYYFHPLENNRELNNIHPNDIVIVISQSGETPELMTTIPLIKTITAGMIAITAKSDSALAKMADICIDLIQCNDDVQSSVYYSNITLVIAIGNALAICLKEYNDNLNNNSTQIIRNKLQQPVVTLMHKQNIPYASPEESCQAVAKKLVAFGLGTLFIAYPNGVNYQLLGSISDDKFTELLAKGDWNPEAPVDEFMQLSPRTVYTSTSVEDALFLMQNSKQRILPVVNKLGLLVGYLTLHDFIKYTV